MQKLTFLFLISAQLIIISCNSQKQKNEWVSMFDGKELPKNHHYLGKPDSSYNIPGYKRDSNGNYLESLGWNDPLNVYSVDTLDNEPVIRISGQVIGGLVLAKNVSNYHLKLKFKWGNKKWSWMKGRPKDGGILYHGGNGVRHEFQIHEGDVGSYWAKKVILDIPARYTSDLPKAIKTARPFLKDLVSTLRDTMLIFDPNSSLHHFEGKDEWQIVLANPYNENAHGEWNTLELICYDNHAIHKVNGKTNLVLLNSFVKKDNELIPITGGRLALQSEGAEIFFKDIYIKKLDELPPELSDYLK